MRRRWWRSDSLRLAIGLLVIITQISAQNTEESRKSVSASSLHTFITEAARYSSPN